MARRQLYWVPDPRHVQEDTRAFVQARKQHCFPPPIDESIPIVKIGDDLFSDPNKVIEQINKPIG